MRYAWHAAPNRVHTIPCMLIFTLCSFRIISGQDRCFSAEDVPAGKVRWRTVVLPRAPGQVDGRSRRSLRWGALTTEPQSATESPSCVPHANALE